jgi:hypothetical protein
MNLSVCFYIALQDDFVGHIVENDVTIHGLTVRMDQLMDQNKNFSVIYGAKVHYSCCYCKETFKRRSDIFNIV